MGLNARRRKASLSAFWRPSKTAGAPGAGPIPTGTLGLGNWKPGQTIPGAPGTLAGQPAAGVVSNLQPDYSDAEAIKRFGADILTLEQAIHGAGYRWSNGMASRKCGSLCAAEDILGLQVRAADEYRFSCIRGWRWLRGRITCLRVAVDGAVVEVAAERRHRRRSRRCRRYQRPMLVG